MISGEVANELSQGEASAEPAKADPKALFKSDRGERAYYLGAGPTDSVRLPITRDGFEALIERATTQFDPPLPVDNSVRKVAHGYIHHIENEKNEITIELLGRVLWKSIVNAMTWHMDQEIKMKENEALAEVRAKAEMEKAAKIREERISRKEQQQARKASRRTTVRGPDEQKS